MGEAKAKTTKIEPLMTTEEVGELFRCSTDTVLRYAREKGLPRIRVGRKTRFDRRDVLDWLAGYRIVENAVPGTGGVQPGTRARQRTAPLPDLWEDMKQFKAEIRNKRPKG
jgi:excisionase family DNA binding protein